MGGVEMDLTEASIDDPPVTLETTLVMGGAQIKVPEHWKVINDMKITLGGVQDSDGVNELFRDEAPDLILTVKVILGGLSITRGAAAVDFAKASAYEA